MAPPAPLELTREQILAHRRRVSALDERLPMSAASLRRAAWAGLQDSVPRAALLSIHARVDDTQPDSWEDPALVQLWGPRFSAFVVASEDVPYFTLGRLPDPGPALQRAERAAAMLAAHLDGRRMTYGEAGHAIGVDPNSLRYGAPTGTILIRWEGARQPVVWTVPRPDVAPMDARLELARRYLHVMGPGTSDAFSNWAGIKPPRAHVAFERLGTEMLSVATPVGDAWILATDEASFRNASPTRAGRHGSTARLLPSGDTYYLFWGRDRELLVPDAARRAELWTSRVWPGAVVVDGEVVGTWRRANADLSIQPWRRFTGPERDAIQAEAEGLPLPDVRGRIVVRWDEAA
jgi:hypothetical protein